MLIVGTQAYSSGLATFAVAMTHGFAAEQIHARRRGLLGMMDAWDGMAGCMARMGTGHMRCALVRMCHLITGLLQLLGVLAI